MSNAPLEVDSRQYRNALGAFATGVTIVTTRDASGHDVGLTASSFNSVSLEPPMVLWSLAKTSGSLDAFMTTEHFAVHVLSAGQQHLSDRFSKRGIDKFAEVEIQRGPGNIPLLNECSARFICRTTHRYEGGDHIIFVGEVAEFDHSGHPPLAFHGGKYAKVLCRTEQDSNDDEAGFNRDFLMHLAGLAAMQLYLPVQNRLLELGLSEREYFLLTVLAAGKHRSLADMQGLATVHGSVSGEDVKTMVEAGLVMVQEGPDGQQFDLSPRGNELAVELSVLAKLSEQAGCAGLDWDDLGLLKHLLKKVIRNLRS